MKNMYIEIQFSHNKITLRANLRRYKGGKLWITSSKPVKSRQWNLCLHQLLTTYYSWWIWQNSPMSSLYKQRICERIIISKAFHLYDNKSYQQMSKIVDCLKWNTSFNLQPHKKKVFRTSEALFHFALFLHFHSFPSPLLKVDIEISLKWWYDYMWKG